MLYSILIYGTEGLFDKLSPEAQEALLGKHRHLQETMRDKGKLGPFARLMPTTTAVAIRGGGKAPLVTDGPYAETKEALLGFYIVECDSLEEAIEAAKLLPLDVGTLEVRPVSWFGGEHLHAGG